MKVSRHAVPDVQYHIALSHRKKSFRRKNVSPRNFHRPDGQSDFPRMPDYKENLPPADVPDMPYARGSVGSPGLQLKFHQTSELLCISGLPSGQNPVMRHRPVSPLKIHHASQTAILFSCNRGIHDTRNRHNLSLHNRKIRPVNPGCF